ncbi:BNR repeat protein [Mucilaginibacter oryzae]|uniref:BNR repeat protein n=1 Tax=Mucilaginibacter oryzae TaxID=468058 RepID=A0A316HB62_9SPHI|nr:sialidase family protein [Mucilaginibacter oryzae]PWK77736.1 BNR repeat protein [Mucilaginibacter oryzae]
MKKENTPILFFVIFITLTASSCKKNTVNSAIIDPPPVTHGVSPDSFSSLTSDSSTNTYFLYNVPVTNKYIAERGWEGVSTIGIKDSVLYAAWYCGKKGEEIGNYITISKSMDWGKTWINNDVIIASQNDFDRQIDPSLWNDKFGNLHISWTSISGGWDGGKRGMWNMMIKQENNHTVMTKPVRMFSGEMSVKPTPIGPDSSTMIFPAFGPSLLTNTWNGYPATPTPRDLDGPILYRSTYLGDKSAVYSFYSKIPVDLTKRDYDEEMVVANNDTAYTALSREKDGIYISYSQDKGLTWTSPVSFTGVKPMPASRFYFGKLKSGNILLVGDHSTWRNNLTAFISKDNGKTWPYKLVLDTDTQYGAAYPDVTQDKNGKIYIIYEQGRIKVGRIILAKFSENDVLTKNQSAIEKNMIYHF